MPYEFIEVEKKDHLTVFTINRPKAMNSLHPPACAEMDEAFDEFAADPEAWVGIVTAAGERAFCAGNDLKWQAEHGEKALRAGLDPLKGGFGGITRRFDLFKPLIAAVNGLAFGGGFEIVLSCDIIVAAENAAFALPEPTVGVLAGAGGVQRLPKRMPYHVAMGLILTGERITAQEAKEMRLVNDVVPLADLMATAEKWAEKILKCAPLAVRAAKEAVLTQYHRAEELVVGRPFPGSIMMKSSEDFLEGPRAFAEKRKPEWKGR